MRLLTVTVVVISIGVIGAGIGLAQYLGMSTRTTSGQSWERRGGISNAKSRGHNLSKLFRL